MLMSGIALLYSLVFLLYAVMEVLGIMPQEVQSAGLTLPALFSRHFGDQNVDFIGYHTSRTTITLLCHFLLPLIFSTGLGLVDPELNMFNPWRCPWSLTLLWVLAVVMATGGVAIATLWSRNCWQRHPLMRQLSRMGQPARSVAMSINLEFRDVDKFVTVLGGSAVIVTDSWILQTNVHSVDAIHQRDAVLHVCSSVEHNLTLDGRSAQYLTIRVNSINANFKSFTVRLNSLQYAQLTDRLLSPIRIARNILIHQSLSDRFTAAFNDQIARNGSYTQPPGSPALEPCVGCLQALPEVKLSKQCDRNQCRQCFCRPMWCVQCISKWFAARQDQHRPDSWLGGSATCPMCRAPFCVIDVLHLDPFQLPHD